MVSLRDVRDSFVHFLGDNLVSPITVHAVRMDPNNRGAEALQMNSVNVHFLGFDLGNGASLSSHQAIIDVINDDESTAVDWVQSVWGLLNAAFFTPVFTYVVPASPVAKGYNIMWDSKKVRFKNVTRDGYVHFSCVLPVQFRGI